MEILSILKKKIKVFLESGMPNLKKNKLSLTTIYFY